MSDQYYRFFPGDYLRDTGDLTLVEHGAYHMLLHHYYTQETLSSDRSRLYRMCRAFTQEEQEAIDTVVERYFKENGHGNLINRKAEKEIAGRRAFFEEQARKAKLGAEARWGEKVRQEMPAGMPGGIAAGMPAGLPGPMPERCPPSPSPSPYPIKEKQPKKKPKTAIPNIQFFLPEWIEKDLWDAFVEHRKKLKRPMTERAKELIVKKLTWMKDKGHNPKHVLMTSIERGWMSVFEPDENR